MPNEENTLEKFYYWKSSSRKQLQDSPTGLLSVIDLVNGRPPWIVPRPPLVKTKKKLILSDWSLQSRSLEEMKKIQLKLAHLMSQGFAIYIWESDETTKSSQVNQLTEEKLKALPSKVATAKIPPAYPDEIITQAYHQQRLTQDEVHILDDYWLNQLIDIDTPETRCLRVKSYMALSKENQLKLLEMLKQAIPPITKIINNEFSMEALSVFSELCDLFPNASKIIQYETVSVSNDTNRYLKNQIDEAHDKEAIREEQARQFEQVRALEFYSKVNFGAKAGAGTYKIDKNEMVARLESLSSQLNRLVIRADFLAPEAKLELAPLPNLHVLETTATNLTADDLAALINASPNLEKLKVQFCKNLNTTDDIVVNKLNTLQEIKLQSCNLSDANLLTIFAAADNLITLEFSCHSLKNIIPGPINLQQLTTLNVRATHVDLDALKFALAATPKLKDLRLSHNEIENGPLELTPKSLPDLERISLLGPSNSSFLLPLLVAAPNLKSLDVIRAFASFDPIPPQSLNQLESLSLQDTSLFAIVQFLHVTPNLKILRIYENKLTEENSILLAPGSLPELKKISLTSSTFSTAFIETLLAAAPNITELEFSSCETLGTLINTAPNTLNDLHVLSWSSCSIGPGILEKLLAAGCAIHKLNLSHCVVSEEALNLKPGTLTELELLNIKGSVISTDNIQFLFQAAPNLKILRASRLDFVRLEKLPSLLELDLSNSTEPIPLSELEVLLHASPNLHTLNLESCRGLTGKLHLPPGSLPFLEEINIEDCVLTQDDIDMLRAAAPNLKRTIGKPQAFVQAPPIMPEAPIHDPKEMLSFKPPKEDEPFVYKGKNSKNQGMIIEKLSQYLTLTKQHLASIPRMKIGICNALTHYYIQSHPEKWEQFITDVSAWDGKQETLTPVQIDHFDTLYSYVQQHQFNPDYQAKMYLGDNLELFLKGLTAPCILINPWHAISIKRQGDSWIVYDPNHDAGARVLSQEDLVKNLHDALGELILVESPTQTVLPRIQDPNRFIEDGGLLALFYSTNTDAMLAEIPVDYAFSKQSLDGIFSRNNKGIPAWVSCLDWRRSSGVAALTLRLLQQFILLHPADHVQALQSSMEMLTPLQKQECMTRLIQLFPKESRKMRDELIAIIRETPSTDYYEKQLQTWRRTSLLTESLDEYCQKCVQPEMVKKRLIELSSANEVMAMHEALQRYCKDKRHVFYVNSPDDLICSASFIERGKNNRGELKGGPGGPLHDFLTAKYEPHHPPIIIVNYEHFNADDIVRFNTLLDPTRITDGTSLPDPAIVIGLININKPDCYQGADFYSRFDLKEACPISKDALANSLAPLPLVESTGEVFDRNVINLFHAMDWEERLLGRWVLDGDTLRFEEGALMKADFNQPIVIQNGLWEEEDFQHFWRQACLRGSITYAGQTIILPANVLLVQEEGYPWDVLCQNVTVDYALSATAIALNPGTLNFFFSRYAHDPLHLSLRQLPGMIAAAKAKSTPSVLEVNVTRALDENQWAMVLSTCNELGVKLIAHCAPGVVLPAVLTPVDVPIEPEITPVWNKTITQPTEVITSTDIDTTLAMLTKDPRPNDVIIDVTECNASDLLLGLNGRLITPKPEKNGVTGRPYFEFTEQKGALIQALNDGNRVILKGHFASELADELAEYLLERQRAAPPPGELILLTEEHENPFFGLPTSAHTVLPEEKISCMNLEGMDAQNRAMIELCSMTETLSQLKARAAFLHINPAALDTEEAWVGLTHLSSILENLSDFHVDTAEEEAAAFIEDRLKAVNSVLKVQPYVFLTGLSGVGKSTFVEKELAKAVGQDNLYLGEKNMEAWAKNKTPGQKILFIDEANLSLKQWSEFEGLFHNPPGILIKGVYYPLSQDHKVVFAGNPCSYGDERTLSPFFARHGNAVLFKPLPGAVLYQGVLKPVFENTFLQEHAAEVSVRLLEVYRFLCECSKSEILISPRELQMMALLILSHAQRYPEHKLEDITKQVSWQAARHLVPETHQETFDTKFKPETELPQQIIKSGPGFVDTPSRKSIQLQLDALLALRNLRRSTKNENEARRYGGLGGLIIEGEPAAGKSELVVARLLGHGFKEMHHDKATVSDNNPVPDKLFYRMPVSMSLDEKKKLLLNAFHQGAVVIIDEINSSPMMERLLNDLLMGKTSENIRPDKPGFMVIGTQNPVTMAGRRLASTALQRRLLTMKLPAYPPEEIEAILRSRNVSESEAKSLVAAYGKTLSYAKTHHLSPPPTFRDLLRLADEVARSAKIHDLNMTLNNELFIKKEAFYALLDGLSKKIKTLEEKGCKTHPKYNPKYVAVGKAAHALYQELDEAAKSFFNNPPTQETLKIFDKRCTKAIADARLIFKLHRSRWSDVRAIMMKIIGLITALFALPIFMIKKDSVKKGYASYKETFFTKPQTDSSKTLQTFEKGLQDADFIQQDNKSKPGA